MEQAGSEFALRRLNISLDCCLYSVKAFSVYWKTSQKGERHDEDTREILTDSSSTLAARGRASCTLKMVVDLTILSKWVWVRTSSCCLWAVGRSRGRHLLMRATLVLTQQEKLYYVTILSTLHNEGLGAKVCLTLSLRPNLYCKYP